MKTHGEAKAPSQRQLRVGEELRHVLAQTLERGELRDPDLEGVIITVTEVRVSPDLRNATAFVLPLGGHADDMGAVLAALGRASTYLRHQVGRQIRLKYLPAFSFKADPSFDAAGRIDALLHDPAVARDLVRDADAEDTDDQSGDAGDKAGER